MNKYRIKLADEYIFKVGDKWNIKEFQDKAKHNLGLRGDIRIYNDKRRLLGLNELLLREIDGKITLISVGDIEDVIIIPPFITHIGDEAFGDCRNIKKVRIHDNVKYLGNGAFYGCDSLEYVNIPANIEYIGFETFYSSGIEEVDIADGVKNIPDRMFLNCKNLRSIKIPYTVESIGKYAFNECLSLEKVELSENIRSIGT